MAQGCNIVVSDEDKWRNLTNNDLEIIDF